MYLRRTSQPREANVVPRGQRRHSAAVLGLLIAFQNAPMADDYDIALATPADIPGILALQEENLPDRGGSLSVRLAADWFAGAMQDMPLIVARRGGALVGYVVATSVAAQLHIPIVEAMVGKFPPPPGAYIQGPVCVAASERGKGVAALMFAAMRARLPGRAAVTFIRSDNKGSLRAHEKMGIAALGEFDHGGARYTASAYTP
jgi:GNAT superfamily N-acetyltransferase